MIDLMKPALSMAVLFSHLVFGFQLLLGYQSFLTGFTGLSNMINRILATFYNCFYCLSYPVNPGNPVDPVKKASVEAMAWKLEAMTTSENVVFLEQL